MPSTYGADHADLKPAKLDDPTLAAIGRLVRAFSEYEELVSLYIGALSRLNQSELVVLLGRTAVTRRLEMAEMLAKLAGEEELARFKAAFHSPQFKDIHQCRNAVAHGILLGMDDTGMLAFLTDKTDAQPDDGSTIQIVASYHPKLIESISIMAEGSIDSVADHLRLRSWLKRHQPQALRPHRKAQPRRGKGGKPQPPLQS